MATKPTNELVANVFLVVKTQSSFSTVADDDCSYIPLSIVMTSVVRGYEPHLIIICTCVLSRTVNCSIEDASVSARVCQCVPNQLCLCAYRPLYLG